MNPHCRCEGAIFDLDGVITQTARIHFKAWLTTFDGYLQRRKGKRAGIEVRLFTHEEDYLPYVDGKPRFQGVKSFLESRDINHLLCTASPPTMATKKPRKSMESDIHDIQGGAWASG